MPDPLKLMFVLAHPDDESLGAGGTIARYVSEGVEVHLLTATRGERGWMGAEAANPGLARLGEMREAELMSAARVLGIKSVSLLGYIDGDLDQASVREIVTAIVSHVRRIKPQVVVTFGPDGGYGHPDHIAISQFTTAALIRSADAGFAEPPDLPPHAVSKLYYLTLTAAEYALYEQVFGELVMLIDGVERRAVPAPEWMITTRIHTAEQWNLVRNAIACHRTQLPGYDALLALSEETLRRLWEYQEYCRVFSTVNSGREQETDLFEGLRKGAEALSGDRSFRGIKKGRRGTVIGGVLSSSIFMSWVLC